jgi:transcriptional regulator with XRE-family HTH domain
MASDEYERARKALGERLRKAREVASMTQAAVADTAGVHVNYYARVECGEENPSFKKLQSVMKALQSRYRQNT